MGKSFSTFPSRGKTRTRSRASSRGRWACRLSLFLLVLACAGFGYLYVGGFPETVTERVRAEFAELGYEVRLDRLRLNPFKGIVADKFHLFLDDADRYPVVEAAAVVIGFDPLRWGAGEHGMRRLRIRDGVLRIPAESPLLDDESPHVLSLEVVRVDVRLEEDGLRLYRLGARFQTIDIRGDGFAMRDPVREPDVELLTADRLRSFLDEQTGWLLQVAETANALHFEDPPELHFSFFINPLEPEADELSLVMEGAGTRYRGLPFDGWRVEARMEGRRFHVPVCKVFHEERRFEAEGEFDLADRTAEARIYSNLSPVYWRNLMPAEVRAHMESARVHPFGPTEAELTFVRAPLAEFGRQIHGWFEAEQLDAHGVWLESIRAEVRREEERIRFDDIVADIGRDEQQGTARGEAAYDIAAGSYHGQVNASFDPRAVLPVAGYSRIAGEIIRSLSFDDSLPSVDVVFSGSIPPDPGFHFEGDIRGSNFLYRGSIIRDFDTTFLVTNRVMRMDPLHVKRDEGTLDGWYEQDFNRRITDLDVVSGVDPKALARVGGGVVERILRPFRFEGDVDLHVRGRIDYGAHKETDYIATGEAEQVGGRWISADYCSMDWIAKGDRILMSNLHLRIYGGELDGFVELDGVGEEPVRYTVDARVADVSFSELLRAVRQTEMDLQEGSLSGRIDVEGLAEDDWRASLTGEGRVRIRKGEVFQIPLFGGLSQLLGRIYPGLGFAVQTDARADFEILERMVRSDDIRIEGSVLSLRGEGRYHLDDELDFKVQVQPLRRGFLVDALRLVTYPVSRLLQLRLEGTLSEPRWVVDTLPRDLWRVLERDE